MKRNGNYLILCISLIEIIGVNNEMISMKIVDEPSSYGLSNSFGGTYQTQEETLTTSIHPANFSGPPHLKRLVGKCFSMIDANYKYEFCPFQNLTQHEQSLRWNPYSGVLGVYQEWDIVNNSFVAMVMKEGDDCGEIKRSVKVFFKCSNYSHIANVKEPDTCRYHIDFSSPLVCHKHAMLVYPTMQQDLRMEWDALEGELASEMITKQGYDKKLKKIFEKAGYHLSAEKHNLLSSMSKSKKDEDKTEFPTLIQCSEEVTKLRAEITRLSEALILNSLQKTGLNATDDVRKSTENIKKYQDI